MTSAPPLPEPVGPEQVQSPENRRAMSQRFIIQAREEFERGDRIQAGEKAWGAVAQQLKLIGEQRGWRNNSHRQLESIGRQIRAEYPYLDSPELAVALSDAYHKGHENFYDNHFYDNRRDFDEIEDTVEEVENILPVLESIGLQPPRFFEIQSNSQLRRLVEITGNSGLQIGDISPVGFSLRH